MDFLGRVCGLPRLGIGVSTEYGARSTSGVLDPLALRARRPDLAGFLELGVEVDKGLDEDARRWVASGAPVTYHFLDVNLDEPEDFDRPWLDAVRGLVDLPLTATERGWLVGPDRRAYGVDPLRRHRSLQALLEEHPVSVATLAAGGVAVRSHDGFFSGPRFHGAIQGRRSLATASGDHLAALAQVPLQRGVIALERAMAEARRGVPAPWTVGAELRLAGTVRVVACPRGTLDAYGLIRGVLERGGRAPLETLLAGPVRLPRTPVDPAQGDEHVLVEATAGQGDAGASLSFQSEELAGLLAAARPGATRAALLAQLGEAGIEPAEADELLAELIADGRVRCGARGRVRARRAPARAGRPRSRGDPGGAGRVRCGAGG